MGTHRITIELEEGEYNILQKVVATGRYPSESKAIADIIPDLLFETMPQPGEPGFEKHEAWVEAELGAAVQEHDAHPDELYTGDEVKSFLAEKRRLAS